MIDPEPHLRFDRRQETNLERYATFFAILLNVAGLVWGAARLTGSVDELRRAVAPLVIQANLNASELAVLKDRFERGKNAGK